jgi:hypothetical protein
MSSVVVQGAIPELRSLAAAALARAIDEPAAFPAQLPFLSALLMPEGRASGAVLRRAERMNGAMPFAEFEPLSPLQRRVLASGVRPGLLERVVMRLRKRPAPTPPGWIDATLRTALAAPAFAAQAQMIAYRGLRRRMFFGPDGPPPAPLSVETFLALIVRSGRPQALPPQAWARLEEIARQRTDQPGWAGPMDRLILAEARKAPGRAEQAAPDPGRAVAGGGPWGKGIGNVSG